MYNRTLPPSYAGKLRKIAGLEALIERGWFYKGSFNKEGRRKHFLSKGDIQRAQLTIRAIKAKLGVVVKSAHEARLEAFKTVTD